MSQVLINQYLAQLDRLKKVGGTTRETVVREAFKDLFKGWGKQHDLVFIPEYRFYTSAKDSRSVDGALVHELRVPYGYWEAKDVDDDIDEAIATKLKRGYPKDNIIFENSTQAVLIQDREEVMRCDVTDVKPLEKLLKLFFGYERPEIAEFRKAVDQFKLDLPAVLLALRGMIELQHKNNSAFRTASKKFLAHAQEAINPSLTAADVREMLIQHVLTEEIFSKVFNSEFHRDNNVARELYKLEETFFTGGLKQSTLKGLEPYYAAIRTAASQIGSHHEKQTFLKVIYENFYKVYNAKAADRLGVVYTPNEIVRFMIEGADWLCEKHFGRNLIDKDVEILDPATGTGTFICELLEHFRGSPAKLKHKYLEELHANEVAILPYYVANLNIEATFAAITDEYLEFKNLCFVDTLDNVGLHTAAPGQTVNMFGSVSEENVVRIKRQNSRTISVIIGNPPYNANQANENDNNKNREYREVDARIKQTYIHESTAQKTKLYDMYARFFRWASDRLAANGVLAFVTNRSFVESRTFDGFRKVVGQEFAELYVVDLGGDVRANPKLSGTKNNVFGIQTGVAISFLVKCRGSKAAHVSYARRPELETAEDKLAFLGGAALSRLEMDRFKPDAKHNWINLSTNDFETLIPIASKEAKASRLPSEERAIFKLFSLGISTNRDDWLYDLDVAQLAEKAQYLIHKYDAHRSGGEDFDTSIKWSETLKRRSESSVREPYDAARIRRASYRPFFAPKVYLSSLFIDRPGASEEMFPGGFPNRAICFSDAGSRAHYVVLAVDGVADLHFGASVDAYQQVPLYRVERATHTENVTDWSLAEFEKHYQSVGGKKQQPITKEAIFHYVYAVLHDPLYREQYAQNLKREFPRIPFYGDSSAVFWKWANWGAELMGLHIGYEAVKPFALKRTDIPDKKARAAHQPPTPSLKADKSVGCIVIDSETTLTRVPADAWRYQLGNRCALEWVLDQYKEKRPKDPTIRAKFDSYRLADYKEHVIDLLARVTTVSVETMRIIDQMQSADR
ncbi:MAG TPA: type ISP restriction/modification enzyme [Planctomycetota bacterium]|jgi:predicted helicase|nr:type ISP restriction/modification enzyme [Planctomycetota bacterium]